MPRVVDQRPRSVADKDPLRGLLDFQDLDKTIEDSGNRIRGALNKVRDDFIEWLREVTGIDLSGALEFTDWLFEEIRSRVGVDLENLAALLEDLGDLDLASLLDAVRGDYDGDSSVLLGIQSSIGSLRSLAAGIIAPWRIPQLTLSQLTAQPSPNLLTGFGDFAAGSTLDGDGVWTWDGAVGKTTPGSARTTADGTLKVLTSEAIAVAAGQQLECSGWVRWQGATGSGPCMQLLVVPYVGAAAQTPVVISNIVAPPGTVGVSSESTLAGSYVVAANVNAVRVRLTVEAAMTAGTVWWDDAALRKTATSLPQQWVSGLTGALDDLGDWVEAVVNQLLGALGVPAIGTLFDKIADLSDEVEEWLADTQDRAAELANLVSGLLTNPGAWLGNLSVGKITGLAGELADKASTTVVATVQNFILGLANAILSAIRKVPVVGGTIADRIEEVVDDLGGLKDQADGTKVAIVDGWIGDEDAGDPDVNATIQAMRAAIEGEGYTRVNFTSTQSWTVPSGATELILIGIAAGQDGAGTSTKNGGNAGRAGGHKVVAVPLAGVTSLYVEVGTNGAATRFRKNGPSGDILLEVLVGAPSALATLFGYSQGVSSAAGGGGGGRGYDTAEGASNGTPGIGQDGGQDGSAVSRAGGAGGSSAGAPGGAGGGNSADGSNGGSVGTSDIPCGGGGGGGGGGGSGSLSNGGDGGDGGFPGGGGGGGGGRGQTGAVFPGSGGSGGAGGQGLGIAMYR